MSKRASYCALLLLIVGAALTLLLTPMDYALQDRDATLAPSSARHWTGTDAVGFAMARSGSPPLFYSGSAGATAAAAITTSIAAGFGLIAAFSHHAVASVLMFISDVFLSLPWLFLLMMARAMLPLTASPIQTAILTFLCLAALGWPACARTIYRGAVPLRSAEWLIHGRAGGSKQFNSSVCTCCPICARCCSRSFWSAPAFAVQKQIWGRSGSGSASPCPPGARCCSNSTTPPCWPAPHG